MDKNYILAYSWARANIQNRLWYCMEDTDKDAIADKELVYFGDKCYVIKTKKTFIMGNDNTWYET